MLKSWVQNQDIGEIEVEEKYISFVRNLRTDRYATAGALYNCSWLNFMAALNPLSIIFPKPISSISFPKTCFLYFLMLERCRSFSWRSSTGDRREQKALSANCARVTWLWFFTLSKVMLPDWAHLLLYLQLRSNWHSPSPGLMLDNALNPFDLDGLFSHLGRRQIAQRQKCTKCSKRLWKTRKVVSPQKQMCLVCTISISYVGLTCVTFILFLL